MSKNSKPEYGLLEVTFSGHQDTCKDKKYIPFEIIRKLLLWTVVYITIHLSKSSCASFKFSADCRVMANPSAAIIVSKEFHPCLT